MTNPGDHLRRWVSRFLSADSMTRVVDPAVADLQAEHAAARVAGRIWASRRAWLIGSIAVLRAVLYVTCREIAWAINHPSEEDRHARFQMLGWSIGAFGFALLLVAGPVIATAAADEYSPGGLALMALLPQAMPLAIPVGIALGLSVSSGHSKLSRHLLAVIAALAIGGSAMSFVVAGWVAPVANQAFRGAAAVRLAPHEVRPTKGTNELTLGELRATSRLPYPHDRLHGRRTEMRYYSRIAIPFASLVLAAFVIAARPRRTSRVWNRIVRGLAVCGGYFGLVVLGQMAVERGITSAIVGVWLANVTLAMLALSVSLLRGQQDDRPTQS